MISTISYRPFLFRWAKNNTGVFGSVCCPQPTVFWGRNPTPQPSAAPAAAPISRSFATKPFNLNIYDPKEIKEMLEEVEDRLAESDKEKYGKRNRGRGPIHALLRSEAPSNRKRSNVNLKTAYAELNTLIYTRHALRHGAKAIKELKNPKIMAKTFLGEDTNQKIDIREGRTILLNLWRQGKSDLLEKFQRDHNEYIKNKQKVQEKIMTKAEARKKIAEELAREEAAIAAEEAEIAAQEEALKRRKAG